MVALAVPSFGAVRPVCDCKPLMRRAAELCEAGDLVAAGMYLKQAACRVVRALAAVHSIEPKRRERPIVTLRKLLAGDCIDAERHHWLRETLLAARDAIRSKCTPGRVVIALLVLWESVERERFVDFPE